MKNNKGENMEIKEFFT